ncbi:hypothetical protein [Falsiroseomonas sp. CW058]|uniref:hypothetical protein n=1 Tax=Falsiroseomonas sp. CW058 TaxID=3388664 RepID=UPI003D31B928
MTHPIEAEIAALEAALAAETRALAAGDLRGAAALGTAKQLAIEAFVAARDRLAGDEAGDRRLALPLDRLRSAIAANRGALERAMALQGRVVEAIARAAICPPGGEMPGYARPAMRGAGPVAFSLRA